MGQCPEKKQVRLRMFPDFQSNEFMELSQLDFLEYFPFKVSASWLNWHMLFFTEYWLKDGSYWPFYFLSVDIYSYCQFNMSIVNNKADRQWRPSTLLLTYLLMRRTPLLGIWFSEGSYRQWVYSFSMRWKPKRICMSIFWKRGPYWQGGLFYHPWKIDKRFLLTNDIEKMFVQKV